MLTTLTSSSIVNLSNSATVSCETTIHQYWVGDSHLIDCTIEAHGSFKAPPNKYREVLNFRSVASHIHLTADLFIARSNLLLLAYHYLM